MSNEQEATRLLKKIVRMHEGRATAINVPTLSEMKEIADFLNTVTPEPVNSIMNRILRGDEFYYDAAPSIIYHVISIGIDYLLETKVTGGWVNEGILTGHDDISFRYIRNPFGNTISNTVNLRGIKFINQ